MERARNGKGPSLVISDVVRLLPHSSSDDQRKYRSDKDLDADKKRDPLFVFASTCIDKKIATQEDFNKILGAV